MVEMQLQTETVIHLEPHLLTMEGIIEVQTATIPIEEILLVETLETTLTAEEVQLVVEVIPLVEEVALTQEEALLHQEAEAHLHEEVEDNLTRPVY